MIKKGLLAVSGIIIGVSISFVIIFHTTFIPLKYKTISPLSLLTTRKEVIGFLPFWLLGKAKSDYSDTITTLTYFGLTLNPDGSIKKRTNSQEGEPGWIALKSGKVKSYLITAKQNGLKKSLLVFAAEPDEITQLVQNPEEHGKKMVAEVVPIMKEYGFQDLNLDIESVVDASKEAQMNMTKFVRTVQDEMKKKISATLTIEASPTDLIKQRLIDPKQVAAYADYLVIMAYDYHYIGSTVTGPVAPLFGVDSGAEFDIETGVQKTLISIPEQKIILGVPLYGYEWETMASSPHSAIIPGTGLTASNARVEKLLSHCASCSAMWETNARESYLVYKDQGTGTYHQIFIPDSRAMKEKIEYVKKNQLAGVAVWALGYEGEKIMEPLSKYK